MLIEYYKKNVYGIDRFYIKDLTILGAFIILTRRNTLKESDFSTLKILGCKFKQVI